MGIFDSLSFFAELQEEDKISLENFCQLRHLSVGEKIFSQGDDAGAVYILVSGKLEVSRQSENGNSTVVFLEAEDIIGETGVFSQDKKRNADVIASEESSVITILDFSIKELTKKYPELHKKIQKIIDERAVK